MTTVQTPDRMRRQPIDPDRPGFHVPWFVEWVDGKPDYRCADMRKLVRCIKEKKCWMCGERLGSLMAFAIGPMCAINRTTSEPPCHLDCVQYAVRICPFMLKPNMRRNTKDMPAKIVAPAGFHIERNPGCMLIWVTRSYLAYPVRGDAAKGIAEGILFQIGDPYATYWYAEGRSATRAEVLESIESGIHFLQESCERDRDPEGAREELKRHYDAAMLLLPEEVAA